MEDITLAEICAKPGMPDKATVCRWLAQNEQFATAYARAREIQMELWADELRAETVKARESTYIDAQGNRRIDAAAVQLAKVESDNKKWLMSKRVPKKFGTQLDVNAGEGITFSFNVDLSGAGE